MSVYTTDAAVNGGDLTQSEVHLYGSSRLGIYNLQKNVQEPFWKPARILTFTRGRKFFELSNHLGNVLATVSDKKIAFDANGDGYSDYFTPDVVSAQDYYPFGLLMPGRKYFIANTNYRYGFNGKELDKEVSGTTTYDYGFRIYNPGLGRFLSVDPLTKSYPWYTPYQFAGNKPIWALDLDGLEDIIYQKTLQNQTGFKQALEVISETRILDKFYSVVEKQHKFDIAFVQFDAKRTNPGGGVYEDAGWSGQTSIISSKEDWTKNYVARHIPFEEIEASLKAGKQVIIIGISQQKLDSYKNLSVEAVLRGEDFLSLTSITETIVHESKAHALNRLLGVKKSADVEHEEYTRLKSPYSPSILEMLFDEPYTSSEAGKDTRKIYNHLREEYRKVLEFNPDKPKLENDKNEIQ